MGAGGARPRFPGMGSVEASAVSIPASGRWLKNRDLPTPVGALHIAIAIAASIKVDESSIAINIKVVESYQ